MSSSVRALPALVFFASVGLLSIGCKQREVIPATQSAALTPVPMKVASDIPPPPPAAPVKENAIDTSSAEPPLSSKTILPPPVQRPASSPKVRTPSDERLPSWVPVTGRLTVVSSHDLAKNLGMPQPTSNDASASNGGST